MANNFKKVSRRIVNAVLRNEAKRETLMDHIHRINQLAIMLDENAMLDLQIKIDDSKKNLAKMEDSEEKKVALYQLKNYEAFLEYNKKLKEKV